ncbi:MAG: hypothetical protein M3548_17635 [Actinomycetota bacterium]|nr:hypothetical protein [Actinomycetota bacterium]
MTGGFDVTLSALHSAASGFGKASEMLGDAGRQLGDGLGAQGQCWGGDESGQTFAKDYVPNSESILKAIGELTTALAGIKTALDESANSHRGTDGNSGQGFGQMYT